MPIRMTAVTPHWSARSTELLRGQRVALLRAPWRVRSPAAGASPHLPGHGVAEQTATDRQGEDPEVVDEHEHAFETLAYVSRTTSTGAWSLRPRSAATSVRTRHDFTAAAVLVSAYRWSSMNGRLSGLKYVRTSSAEWR